MWFFFFNLYLLSLNKTYIATGADRSGPIQWKYIFTVGSFELETFSQALEVWTQVCKPAEIAARWRCGLPIKNLRTHNNLQFCVSFNFSFQEEPQMSINVLKCGQQIIYVLYWTDMKIICLLRYVELSIIHLNTIHIFLKRF